MAVVEALTEDEAYLWAILSDDSGLDQAEFSWYEPSNQDYCFRAWAFQWKWWREGAAQQIDQCFPGDSLVLTARGHLPIRDVVVGDHVLTHEGRWRPVTGVMNRGKQPVVAIKGTGHWGLKVTADHKFFIDNKFYIPKIGDRWSSPAKFPSSAVPPMSKRGYMSGRPSNVPHSVVSEDFMWLYGLYIAEGSCSSSFGKGGTVNRVTFSVSDKESDYVCEVMNRLGLRYNVSPIKNEKCVNVVVNSRQLAEWMMENGGKGASAKKLGPWVYGLKTSLRSAVFDGLIYGDGHVRKDGSIQYNTVSKALAVDIRLLGQTLLYYTSTWKIPPRTSMIGDRTVYGGESFVVGFNSVSQQQKFNDLHKISLVKSISDPLEFEECYDLEVAEDNSFVVEGIVVHNCARSVGKSLSIKVRACAFVYLHPNEEMVITAPEGNHLEAITDIVETQLTSCRLLREMLKKERGRSAIKHKPFHVNFQNGARIMGRIPQRDGKGIKGVHPTWLELDEGQDYPDAGWVEIVETVNRAREGYHWRAHGVTRGVRDYFYKFTQPDSGWFVHRYAAMWRPTWSDLEREEKIEAYTSRDHPDYKRNILGLHGDATNPLFVLHRLMACFLGDTNVSTPNGVKLIKDLQVGDKVYNFLEESEVLDVIVTERDVIYEVVVDGESIYCTGEHPFYTSRGWVAADSLNEGDCVFGREEVMRMVQFSDSLTEEQKVLLEGLYADMAWTNLSGFSDQEKNKH